MANLLVIHKGKGNCAGCGARKAWSRYQQRALRAGEPDPRDNTRLVRRLFWLDYNGPFCHDCVKKQSGEK